MRRATIALVAMMGVGLVSPHARAQRADRTLTISPSKNSARSNRFAAVRVNGNLSALYNARPIDILSTFYPFHPVVGLEKLPNDRRFDMTLSTHSGTAEEVLATLARVLGLSIRDADATTEFLIIRNLNLDAPKNWQRVTDRDLLPFGQGTLGPQGITEVDPEDHLYTAFHVSMPEFTHFVAERSALPVWNQTSITGHHSFSFRLTDDDITHALTEMGFEVVRRQRTARCVVVSPAAAAANNARP